MAVSWKMIVLTSWSKPGTIDLSPQDFLLRPMYICISTHRDFYELSLVYNILLTFLPFNVRHDWAPDVVVDTKEKNTHNLRGSNASLVHASQRSDSSARRMRLAHFIAISFHID